MGQSETASVFGASVATTRDNSVGLHLVIGDGDEVHSVVASKRGRIITDLGGGRCLALMRFFDAAAVQRHRAIRLCGPVAVDADRFNSFLGSVGMHDPPE